MSCSKRHSRNTGYQPVRATPPRAGSPCYGAMLLAAISASASAQIVPAPAGKQWATTWSDEFNVGQSDLSLWTYDLGGGGWGNNERQTYTSNTNNVFVDTDPATGTGALNIRAIGTAGAGTNVNYTSGRI